MKIFQLIIILLFSSLDLYAEIIEGKIVAKGDYESVVKLDINDKASCTGTLLSSSSVLTAAHCVISFGLNEKTRLPEVSKNKISIKVSLGDGNILIDVKEKNIHVNPEVYAVDKQSMQFGLNLLADIAIITFKENKRLENIDFPAIRISDFPISMENEENINDDTLISDIEFIKYTAVGYGYKDYLLDPEDTESKRFGTIKLSPIHYLSNHQIGLQSMPVNYFEMKEGDDSVQVASGDSGGPLFNESQDLIGVTSSTYKNFVMEEKIAIVQSQFAALYQPQNSIFLKSLVSQKDVKMVLK